MKRSEMIKIIKKVCKSWENSKVTIKMANEILTEIENAGMSFATIDCNYPLVSFDWEPEK